MSQSYQYNGQSSLYVIKPSSESAPADYLTIDVNDEEQFQDFYLDLAYGLFHTTQAQQNAYSLLRTINIDCLMEAEDIGNALVAAIKDEKLSVYKDKAPVMSDNYSNTSGSFIDDVTALVVAAVSTQGKTDETPKESGCEVSPVTSSVPVSEQAKCGDPVSMLTGEELLALDDFNLPGLFPLIWQRLYRSSKIKTNIGLGLGWRHSFSLQLFERYQAPPKVGPKQSGVHWFELVDQEGIIHHFTQVQKGQTSVQPSSGLALLHDDDKRQVLIKPDNSHWTFIKVYDVWQLKSINNELGDGLTLAYDTQHRLISIATAKTRGIILRYNSDNNISRIAPYLVDGTGALQVSSQLLACYQYNNEHELIAAINAQETTEQYKYYAGALLKQRTRASGFNHYFEWNGTDEEAKCIRQWGDEGTYDYHFTYEGNKSTSTDSLGNTEQYFHNEQQRLTCFIDANDNTTEHQYDNLGRKVKTIDAMGNTTELVYNDLGQLSSKIEPDGSKIHYLYNAFGKRIATIDALGQQHKRHFNASGRLLEETLPDGRSIKYTYNEAGKLAYKISEEGIDSYFEWSDSGELLAQKVGEALTRYSYDSLGYINAMCDAQGLITEYQRNQKGQITQQTSYPQHDAKSDNTFPNNALTTRYLYDSAGRLTNIINPKGDNTYYGYGGLAQPTKKTFEDGSWLNYQYDKERNLTGIERSDEATYHIEYSPTEKPTKLIGFDGRIQTYQYDKNDHLIQVNDADERVIKLKRDASGRIVDQHSFCVHKKALKCCNNHNFYQYDKIGRVTVAHNSERAIQQKYHLNGKISHSKQGHWELDVEFNEQGKRSRLILPDGQQISYQYNDRGQLVFLIAEQYEESRQVSRERLVALEYNNNGEIVGQIQGNGIGLKQTFDVYSRLIEQTWDGQKGFYQSRQYHYDKQHQLLRCMTVMKTEIEGEKQTEQIFNYNEISQLIHSEDKTLHTSETETKTYQWDAFGNPEVDNTLPIEHRETRIECDHLLCFSGSDYSYDKSGNQIKSVTTGEIQKRTFDGLNQLRQLSSNGEITHYQYDALGRRSAKITGIGKTDFIWDGNQLIGEHSNGQYTWYIYLPDSFLPVAMLKDGKIYYYHLDQLGTPICLTDSQQKIVWENQGDVFGDESKESNKINRIENPLRFQGQYFDSESGLHYNRFRYYCPKQGRFIHQDPIGLAGGINPYQYAPNPVNWVDPFGLACEKEGASFVAGALALRVVPIQPTVQSPTLNVTKFVVQGAANDSLYNIERSLLSRLAPAIGIAGTGLSAMLYSPSLGGDLDEIEGADGTTYTKYSDEMAYNATSADGEKWSTINPQQDMQFRAWKANGGEGTFEDWLSQGMPDAAEKNLSEIDFDKVEVKDIPTFKSGDFNKWFDERTPEELEKLYNKSKKIRRKVEAGLRADGGMHEFLMVSKAPKWKKWGVTTEQVHNDYAVPTEKLKWTIPSTGELGGHRIVDPHTQEVTAPGSTTFHKELESLIDNSSSLTEFDGKLEELYNKWKIKLE